MFQSTISHHADELAAAGGSITRSRTETTRATRRAVSAARGSNRSATVIPSLKQDAKYGQLLSGVVDCLSVRTSLKSRR
jgi:hypothetical protein